VEYKIYQATKGGIQGLGELEAPLLQPLLRVNSMKSYLNFFKPKLFHEIPT